MKKLLAIYISVLAFSVFGFTWMITRHPSPEHQLIGQWKETAWEYEKASWGARVEGGAQSMQIPDWVRQEAAKNLMVHEAETWTFLPGGKLIVDGENEQMEVRWRIKGRANILELQFDDGRREHYNLTEIANGRLVLNFELDTQIKGIAKLVFEKRG